MFSFTQSTPLNCEREFLEVNFIQLQSETDFLIQSNFNINSINRFSFDFESEWAKKKNVIQEKCVELKEKVKKKAAWVSFNMQLKHNIAKNSLLRLCLQCQLLLRSEKRKKSPKNQSKWTVLSFQFFSPFQKTWLWPKKNHFFQYTNSLQNRY